MSGKDFVEEPGEEFVEESGTCVNTSFGSSSEKFGFLRNKSTSFADLLTALIRYFGSRLRYSL